MHRKVRGRGHGGHGGLQAQDGTATAEEVTSLRALKSSLVRAYRQGKYCDITLVAKDGEEVAAHQLVLGTQSPVFSRLLEGGVEDGRLAVKEVPGEVLRMVVEYIYSGKMKPQLVTKENVKALLAAGEFFGIEDVKEEAAIFMAKNLDVENAVDVMTNEIFVGSISNNAFTFVGHNFQMFLDSEPLKKRLLGELGVGQLCHLLSQKSLMLWDKKTGIYLPALEREKLLFFFVMSYVAHDKVTRLPDLNRLLTCLKLPLLAVGKVLSLAVMAQGLGEKPEELSGQLAEVLEPFEVLTGSENLCLLFADRGKRSQAERRMLSDTCKMRYATLPHTTACSDLAPAANPYVAKQSFCPGVSESEERSVGQCVRGVTVLRADLGAEEGGEDGHYRVTGLRLKLDGDKEESVGEVDHPTVREEEHVLEEGEFIVEVTTHHRNADILKGDSFRREIRSLTSISDLSFTTNKGRVLGPSALGEEEPELGPGLLLSLPAKLRHLEKNCPGKFFWLAGFGKQTVKLSDTLPKTSLYPIWGMQTHFKVYPMKNQTFEFVSGVKKHFQFSVNNLSENSRVDQLEDIEQLERSPVHEVVDLEDSESAAGEESEDEMQSGLLPSGRGGADESVMVLDSESGGEEEEDCEDEDEDEDDEEEERHGRRQGYRASRANPGFKDGKGRADEPIEIESTSEEEEGDEEQVQKSPPKKSKKETNGKIEKMKQQLLMPVVNGGDANLNLSEESSENEDTEAAAAAEILEKEAANNSSEETEKAKKRKQPVTDAKADGAKKASVS